jgi:hypothetical protein
MRRFIAFLGLVLGLTLVAIVAAAWRFIDNGPGAATALTFASGLFTVALAAYIGE